MEIIAGFRATQMVLVCWLNVVGGKKKVTKSIDGLSSCNLHWKLLVTCCVCVNWHNFTAVTVKKQTQTIWGSPPVCFVYNISLPHTRKTTAFLLVFIQQWKIYSFAPSEWRLLLVLFPKRNPEFKLLCANVNCTLEIKNIHEK